MSDYKIDRKETELTGIIGREKMDMLKPRLLESRGKITEIFTTDSKLRRYGLSSTS